MKRIIKLILIVFSIGNTYTYSQTNEEYRLSGLDKLRSENYRGAITEFTKALDIDPKDKKSYYYRGCLKGILEDYQGAIDDYTSALSNGFRQNKIFYMRATAKLSLKDYSGAIDDFYNDLSDNDYVLKARARDTEMYKRYENGGKDFTEKENNKFKRDYAADYLGIGNAKFFLSDFTGAVVSFSDAISIDPNFESAFYKRGLAKLALNKNEEGCLDISIAGGLGMDEANEAIRKYCE